MSNSNKIIIGASVAMLSLAGAVVYLTKKCKDTTSDVLSRLVNIQYTLNQCNKEIVSGNKEISEAGCILRKLVSTEAQKIVDDKDSKK